MNGSGEPFLKGGAKGVLFRGYTGGPESSRPSPEVNGTCARATLLSRLTRSLRLVKGRKGLKKKLKIGRQHLKTNIDGCCPTKGRKGPQEEGLTGRDESA